MLSPFPNQIIQVNPRSVLRPEYFTHPLHFASGRRQKPPLDKRYNTNTAPVYSPENPGPGRKRPIRRSYNHPYSRPFRNFVNQVQQPQLNEAIFGSFASRTTSTIPRQLPLSSDSDESSYFSSSSRVTNSKTSSGSFSPHTLKPEPQIRQRDLSILTKSSTHGQSEQLRRSRESNTFALIDAQLSKPPLSQIRDMYIQSRNACNSSSIHSTSRTTKKVNLSVVHLAVRFRIKEYLRDLQDYSRRLLDTLFSSMFDDYQIGMRSELATKLFGLTRSPCTSHCRFCSELQTDVSRSTSDFRQFDTSQDSLSELPSASPDSLPRPLSSSSSDQSTAPMLSGSDAYSAFQDLCLKENLSNTALTRTPSNFDDSYIPFEGTCKESVSVTNIKTSPSTYELSSIEPTFEKLMPTTHVNDSQESYSSRQRLDSFTLRICNDFDTVDWSSNDVGFGSCGEDPVDLPTLVNESATDFLQLKDSLFDSAFDPINLMHPFVPDKYPSLSYVSTP